jgi:hypothetical protein
MSNGGLFYKMECVCERYGHNKVTAQPTSPSDDQVNSPKFEYGELVTCGNPQETSQIIMEVPRGFENSKLDPNPCYQKHRKMRENGSSFHK